MSLSLRQRRDARRATAAVNTAADTAAGVAQTAARNATGALRLASDVQPPNTPGTTTEALSYPGAQVTSFGADNNLVGTQITPGVTPRQTTAEGYTDQAAAKLAGSTPMPFQPVAPVNTAVTTSALANANQRQQGAQVPGYENVAPAAGLGFVKAAKGLGDIASGPSYKGVAPAAGLGSVGPAAGLGSVAPSATLGSVGPMDASRTNAQIKLASDANARLLSGAGSGGEFSVDAGSGTGGVSFGGDVGRARELAAQGLESSFSSPDRVKLASDAYDQLVQRGQPEFDQRIRGVAQKAGALGRVGAGLTTNDLTDVNSQRERELSLARQELGTRAAGETMQDIQDRVRLASDVASSGGNLDLGAASAGRASSDSAFSNKLAAAGFNRDTLSRGIQGAQSIGDQAYGVDRDQYGDMVSERDKAYNAGQTAYGQAVSERDKRYGAGQTAYEQGVSERDKRYGAGQTAYEQGVSERDKRYGAGRDAYGDATAERDTEYGVGRDQYGDSVSERDKRYGAGQTAYEQGVSERDKRYGAGRDAYGDATAERDTRYKVGGDQYSAEMDKADRERRYGFDQLGIEEGRYGRDVGERDAALSRDDELYDRGRASLSDLAGYEEGIYNRGERGRDELRGERGYQRGEDQRNIDNSRNQTFDEDALLNSRVRRGLDIYNTGAQGSPVGAYGDAADYWGNQARDTNASLADLAEQDARDSVGTGRPAPRPGYDQYGNQIDPVTGRPVPIRF